MNKIFNILLLTMLAALGLNLAACSDNDDEGAPSITGVRITDPEKADSTFTEAYAGKLIVIMGDKLASTKEIYINGQSVPFELTYVTNTHIIVPIPGEIELVATNPELPSEIRVVTRYGEATYAFHINAPDCVLESVAVSQYPLDPGTRITLEGFNFYEVKRVYYTNINPNPALPSEDGEEAVEDEAPATTIEFEITNYVIGEEYDTLSFELPQAIDARGWIVVELYSNTVNVAISYAPSAPEIVSITTDMPISGTEFEIKGFYFIDVMRVNLGSVVVPAEDLTVSEDAKSIKFIVPEIPADYMTAMLGGLSVTTSGGTATVENFYNTGGIIMDFDNVFGWWSWGCPDAVKIVVTDSTPFDYPHSHTCYGQNWWSDPSWWPGDNSGIMVFGGLGQAAAYADIPVGELEFRFEGLFIDFKDAKFYVGLFNSDSYSYQNNGMIRDIYGQMPYGQWSTYAFKLTDFGADPNMTFGEMRAAGSDIMFQTWVNGNLENGEQIHFYIDNLRVYRPDTAE